MSMARHEPDGVDIVRFVYSPLLGVASATAWKEPTKEGAACDESKDDTELDCGKRTEGTGGTPFLDVDEEADLLLGEKPSRPNKDRLRLLSDSGT